VLIRYPLSNETQPISTRWENIYKKTHTIYISSREILGKAYEKPNKIYSTIVNIMGKLFQAKTHFTILNNWCGGKIFVKNPHKMIGEYV
jgi:hypothetical protein